MDEYISKQKAKDLMGCCLASAKANLKVETSIFKKAEFESIIKTIESMIDVVGAVEAADVQTVIHAHWIRGEEKGFRTYNPLWYCSNCGGQIRYDTRMRQYQKTKRPVWEVNAFCRKCGARMDGDT